MNSIQHHRIEEHCLAQSDWLSAQVGQLLKGNDADSVLFFTKTMPKWQQGFADTVMELLGEIGGRECPVVQILIAIEQGNHELASAIYHSRIREHVVQLAEQCIKENAA